MKKIHLIFALFLIISSYLHADYYDGTQGLTGDALKSTLHNIIDDHTTYNYDALRDYILPNTDEDPTNSNNVILLYSGLSQAKSTFGGGVNDWNREHVWAKSHGDFGNTIPCGTDAHHIRPSNVYVNTQRGNKDFDYGGTPVYTYDNSTLAGYRTTDTFEPLDEVKGDVARMIFYMAVRYEGDNGEPDLEVVDEIPSSPSGEPCHAKLSTLMEWHEMDPVDNWEQSRNDKIYNTWQHNRNPFIDHPEFVQKIWGDSTFVEIYDIQHTSDPGSDGTYPSPLEDSQASVCGIVSAIAYNGSDFFITSTTSGAWNGLFIYGSDAYPMIGDAIEITGTVTEYYGFTELGAVTSSVITSSGNQVPEPIDILTGDLQISDSAEQYESMLVKLNDVVVTQAPNSYGEWYVDDGSGECQIDDEIFAWDTNIGDEFSYIIGVVDYSYDEYAVNPRQSDDLQENGISNPSSGNQSINLSHFPNPVKNSTTISFTAINHRLEQTIKIYNTAGKLVKTLSTENNGNGNFDCTWNCTDNNGILAGNGLYFYQLSIGSKTYCNKMLIIR